MKSPKQIFEKAKKDYFDKLAIEEQEHKEESEKYDKRPKENR